MGRHVLFAVILLFGVHTTLMAQRFTDNLDRGLVAVPTGSTDGSTTNFVSWRRLAHEYQGVTYNLYKNGTKVASGLTTTSYDDNSSGLPTTSYQVAAVVNGVEQAKSTAVTPWNQYVYSLVQRCATGYIDIALATVYDRDGADVTAHYEPNDAEMADLDGDGQLEIIVKRLNTMDASTTNTWDNGNMYSALSKEFVVFDAYDVNWQTGAATLMWRIDCGPNMVSKNSTEVNLIAYDWDEDGKAEVVLRGADDMLILSSDGTTKLHTIGTAGTNKRDQLVSHTNDNYAWTHRGNEYLVYIDGETGALYQQMTYPLKRFESNETVSSAGETAAWGDNYGHRSSKYFMGAPFLDGRKASLFLARGIYTRHKMMALDLDKASHTWSTRWSWNCNDSGSDWYGQGFHNFLIADVDEDGRDEIVYGSMVIDDNGQGLSTTGYGHGDAQHVGDFDPYTKGLEYFGCLEESPVYGSNYRNATTSEVRYKYTHDGDDGRALMANFSDSYPGCLGRSIGSGMINSVKNTTIDALSGDSYIAWGDLNFRIYWDGDLCSEILNSPGTAREAKVEKPGTGRLFTSSGCNMNNDSKNNPCFQGDIIGDWREEIVVRCGTGLRVYTSGMSTTYSLPCLWYDHQYRQAMVWQMMGYNQPPHPSFFVGELEGITQAPPPLTNRDRTEIANGGSITTTTNHLMLAETNDMTVSVTDGAAPRLLTVNTPSWVQGSGSNSGITYTYYTTTLTGGALTGTMTLTKQGDGRLILPNAEHTYTGATNVWAGTLQSDGTLASAVWLNRHTALESTGGTFNGGITADYGSAIKPGGSGVRGSMTTTTLMLNHGARVALEIFEDGTADQLNFSSLVLNTKTDDVWVNYGPEYLKPVLQIVKQGSTFPDGRYDLGSVGTMTIEQLEDMVIEGTEGLDRVRFRILDGHLYLCVGSGGYEGTYEYFNDFETVTGTTATGTSSAGTDAALTDATVVGSGTFTSEGGAWGKVFQNVGGSQRTNYLKLPEDVLSYCAESHELTVGFWVKKSTATDFWFSPLFSAYEAAPVNNANTYPMFICQSRGLLQVNCGGWCDFTVADNDNPSKDGDGNDINYEGTFWLDDAEWHYLTIVMTETTAKVCYDATTILNSWTVDGSDGHYISGLFDSGSSLRYICLGGNQAWGWGDNDPAFAFDDIYITNKALSEDEIERRMFAKKPSPLIVKYKGDVTRFIDGDFQSSTGNWTGGTWCTWVPTRSWRGEEYTNNHYEKGETGSMSLSLPNMPAGNYKVVAAARTYDGGTITPQIAGTSGTTLTGVGDTRTGNSTAEINTNGVEMPYSALGGFAADEWAHNWKWISATGTLSAEGSLDIAFDCTGTSWMAIDDVHLYCTRLDGINYTVSATNISSNSMVNTNNTTGNNREVLTCDISVTNPNVIIRTTGVKSTAAGEQLNNNKYSAADMTRLVLYDGYDYSDYRDGSDLGILRITNGAVLYRTLNADTWATLVVPFRPTNLDYKLVTTSLSDEGLLSFGSAGDKDLNNVPMLVKSTAGTNKIEGARAGSGDGAGFGDMTSGTDVTMQGIYTTGKVPASTSVELHYVIGATDNTLHYVSGGNVNIKPFRAYFVLDNSTGGEARRTIMVNFDGDVTGIGTLDELVEQADLRAGKDGKYLENGRIVVVKNGVKYNMNGQIIK